MKILRLTQKDHKSTFLYHVGEFLAMKEVHTEIGEPVYDTPEMVWFVAFNEKGKAVGFASYINEHPQIKLAWAYVMPDQRKKGIYKKLWDARWKEIMQLNPEKITATCRMVLLPFFKKKKFEITKEWKNYFKTELICKK
jgi:predicted GNAT family acetyltransferase